MRCHKRCLGTEQLDASTIDVAEEPGLRRLEQTDSVVERAGLELRLGRGERATRAQRGVGRQGDGALEKSRTSGKAAARLRSVCRLLQLSGHLLVRHRCGLCPMPRAAIRIDLRIRHLREDAVGLTPRAHPRRSIHG